MPILRCRNGCPGHWIGCLTKRARDAATIHAANLKIQALTLELAHHRRLRFGNKSEAFSPEQRQLFQETWDADRSAIEAEVEQLSKPQSSAADRPQRPRAGRQPLRCRASSTATNHRAAAVPNAAKRW